MELLYRNLSKEIIGAFFEVHNGLGPGLPEKNYHNALVSLLKRKGFMVESRKHLQVCFEGEKVGEYYADLVVENKIVIEVKSVNELNESHRAQTLNYMHLSKCRIGFLVNFRPVRCRYKRLIL